MFTLKPAARASTMAALRVRVHYTPVRRMFDFDRPCIFIDNKAREEMRRRRDEQRKEEEAAKNAAALAATRDSEIAGLKDQIQNVKNSSGTEIAALRTELEALKKSVAELHPSKDGAIKTRIDNNLDDAIAA